MREPRSLQQLADKAYLHASHMLHTWFAAILQILKYTSFFDPSVNNTLDIPSYFCTWQLKEDLYHFHVWTVNRSQECSSLAKHKDWKQKGNSWLGSAWGHFPPSLRNWAAVQLLTVASYLLYRHSRVDLVIKLLIKKSVYFLNGQNHPSKWRFYLFC